MGLPGYLAARSLLGLAGCLPWGAAGALGAALGRIAFALDRRHRARAVEAVAQSFQGRSAPECVRIAAGSFAHVGRCVCQFPHLARLRPVNVAGFIEMEGLDRLEEVLARGKGAVLITGHIGFWELTGGALAASGIPLTSIARPIDDRRANAYVASIRSATGQRIIDKEGAMRASLRALKGGGAVGILMDQDAGKDGLFAEFLGRRASTVGAPARLAARTGAPVVSVTSYRDPDSGRHVLRVGSEVEMADTGDAEADALENTRRMNAELGEAIAEHPEQWLWTHRRWKTPEPAG